MTKKLYNIVLGYAKIAICLVSWLSAQLFSRSHNSVNFCLMLGNRMSESKLEFHLCNGTSFVELFPILGHTVQYIVHTTVELELQPTESTASLCCHFYTS